MACRTTLAYVLGRLFLGVVFPGFVLVSLSGGCGSPSKANIQLRKRNATLTQQIADLQRQHEADEASIRGLQNRHGVLPTLSQDRLDKLFTVGSMKVTKLTGGFNLDHEAGPDNGVRAYVQLFDTTGDLIKAAGTFTVEVFDLADEAHPLVARKVFPIEKADTYWYPMPLVYSFVLPVRWQTPPQHRELTVKVMYLDELTQRVFTSQVVVEVNLNASTQPSASHGS